MTTEYITLEDGCDYRAIAKLMTNSGYPMNHATARNVFMSSMKLLFTKMGEQIGNPISIENMDDLLASQESYDSLQEVLYIAYSELLKEGAAIPC